MKIAGLTYLLLMLLCPWAAGQSLGTKLMGTTGDFKSNNGYSLSYSVGELSVSTSPGETYFFTQGFQQPDTMVSRRPPGSGPQAIEVFPNPFQTNLYVNIFIDESPEFWIEVYNLKGSKVYQEKYTDIYYGSQRILNGQSLPKGLYFIKIYSTNGKKIEKFKLVKM